MDNHPIWQWSAVETAENIARGSVSAEQVVQSAVERMRVRNSKINAVVEDIGDQALERARQLDLAFASSGPVGLLHGVPVTIKENVDQKGHATPNGVVGYKNIIAVDDAPVVRNLTRAGAIVIGRTNTPEFSFRLTTDNELHGRTHNPWADWASAGGSSGGSSSAVMSGMGALAHGNDIGGSLRFPAAATGAATVKPSLGRVPAYNHSATRERGILAQLMSVQGVLAREVKDVRLAMRCITAYDPHDPWMVPMPFDGPTVPPPLKVAFTRNGYSHPLHPAVEKALLNAASSLQDAGYSVTEIDPPLIPECFTLAIRALLGENKVLLGGEIEKHGSETFRRVFGYFEELFPPLEGDDLLVAMSQRAHFVRAWQLFLDEYPLVLTPLLHQPVYAWDRDAQSVDGLKETFGSSYHSMSVNFMGLPAGLVTGDFHKELPIGVQLVGRRFREDLILDACAAIESRVGIAAERLFAREA